MDVFFYEAFSEEEEALVRVIGPTVSCGYARETIQESGHAEPPARLICIRTQSVVPPSWSGRIGGILSRTTGFDHLKKMQKTLSVRIPMGYLEEYATRAVAEQAVMMIMALMRKLPLQLRQLKRFERDGLTGHECRGRNLLIVGVGRIGHEVAQAAAGLEMHVRGVDIVQSHTDVTYIGKEEGVGWADVIVCCMDLTPENRGYFSAELLRAAPKGVIFVNVARGDHSPLADLHTLLAEGHLGGLGLDVYEGEPEVAHSFRDSSEPQSRGATMLREILGFSNVICTPHNAFNTVEAVVGKAAFTASQVHHFLKHDDLLWKL